MVPFYKLPPSAICEKEGLMYLHQEEMKKLRKFFCSIKGNIFTYENTQRDGTSVFHINILGGAVRIMETKIMDKTGIEILTPGVSEVSTMSASEIKTHPNKHRCCFYVDSTEEANNWIDILMRCTLPFDFLNSYLYDNSSEQSRIVSQFPRVREMSAPYHRSLLWHKFRIMAIHFDFSKPSEGPRRELKRNVLVELLELVNTMPYFELFSDMYIFQELITAIELALYRVPVEPNGLIRLDEDDEELCNPEWDHLSLVYDILIAVVSSSHIDASVRKHYITVSFVTYLITLFNSPDVRERTALKTATHRIYSKLTNRRITIRRAINHVFYEFLYETRQHCGIAELLEILASIINGFTVPIRPEHLQTLEKSLIPLHKMNQYDQYVNYLAMCMSLFIQKDSSLSCQVFKGLLKYWPLVNTTKELLFLTEMEDIFEVLKPMDVQPFCEQLVKRLAKCLSSENIQVVERTLYNWNNKCFTNVMMKDHQNFVILAKGVYQPLKWLSENHTNFSIKEMAYHVMGLFIDCDMDFMNELAKENEM